MGDEEIFPEEDISTGGGDDGSGKKFGFLPAIVITILKWVAIVLASVIFIVVVVVVTVNILNRGQGGQLPPVSDDLKPTADIMAWYDGIEEIRTRTADAENYTVIVKIKLGYELGDKQVQSDLIQRQPPLQALVRSYFAGKMASELTYKHEANIKAELEEMLNQQLANPRSVKEVIIISMSVINL